MATITTFIQNQTRLKEASGNGNGMRHSRSMERFPLEPDLLSAKTTTMPRCMTSPALSMMQQRSRSSGVLLVKTVEASLARSITDRTRADDKKSLRFGWIEIREYPIMPGDNPAGGYGIPLTIEWNPQATMSIKLDEYEKDRPPRRNGSQMNIPGPVREKLLRESGYSKSEIQTALRNVNIARRHRKQTGNTLHMAALQENTERAKRAVLNVLIRRGKKKEEREYLRKSAELDQVNSSSAQEAEDAESTESISSDE